VFFYPSKGPFKALSEANYEHFIYYLNMLLVIRPIITLIYPHNKTEKNQEQT